MSALVSFRKNTDSPLDGVSRLVFGAAWDRKSGKQSGWQRKLAERTGGKLSFGGKEKDVDLDAALILYRDRDPKRIAIGHNTNPVEGVVHSGDNLTGAGDGDDETIELDFLKLPAWVTEWAVVVTAFKPGTTFDHAQNVSLRVYDTSDSGAPVELDDLMPTLGRGATAVVVATGKVGRNSYGAPDHNLGWTTRLVDKAGRLPIQGNDDALLEFAKHNAGI